jgi:hypothetical protein
MPDDPIVPPVVTPPVVAPVTVVTPPATPPPAVPQDQVDAIVGRTRVEARETATKELLASLGVENVEAAKAVLERQKAADQAAMSDLERAQARAVELEQGIARIAQERDATAIRAEVSGALRDAGIKPERIEAATKLVDSAAIKIENGTVLGAKEAAERIAADFPEFKGGTTTGGAPDVSGRAPGSSDTPAFANADPAAVDKALKELGIRR